MKRFFCLLFFSLIGSVPALADDVVKVFILAGQSNMQGHGKVNAEPQANEGRGSLEWLVKNPETSAKYRHLVDAQGNWRSRNDVQIVYLERHGDLAPGFGHREGFIGPELGFGHVIGEALEEPVLLIKLAWGGKSLGRDFRPPSAGGDVGPYYQEVLKLTKKALNEAPKLFPQYEGRKLEVVGFGWHQGWNDRVNQAFNDEYERNLTHFIRDIRKDLGELQLPFVIAETGMSGREESHPRALSLMKAQAAVAELPEFRGNVAFVGTRDFYRPKELSPSGQAYHWNNNAETYYLIGEGMGTAMLALLRDREKSAAETDRGKPFHVYAPSRNGGKLLIVRAEPVADGLTLSLREELELGFPATTIVAHPEKPLLYVAPSTGEAEDTPAAVITLRDNGSYAEHTAVKLQHGYSYLSLDRANRFMLGANYPQGFVDVYELDRTGLPARHATGLNEGRTKAHCVFPTPDNRFVYIPYVSDSNAIYQYRFSPDSGRLTQLEPKNAEPPAGTGPRHLVYHPSLPIVYFSNEQHLGVTAYDITETGQLRLRQVHDAVSAEESKEGVSSSDLVITPNGRFIFAGIRGHRRDFDWVSRYRVDDEGNIELLGLTQADKIPWGFAISPCGGFLLVTAFEGASITAYAIDSLGNLRPAGRLEWEKNISDIVVR